jgi:hypothetical protein
MRDLTPILMGDPGSSPRRSPTEVERTKVYTVPTPNRDERNAVWLADLLKRPVGYVQTDLTYYAGNKARMFCRANGVDYRLSLQPGVRRMYSIERVK